MSKVGLTGVDGMIGRHMAALLGQQGFEVLRVGRLVWDLTEWKLLKDFDEIFSGVDVIFHFGATVPKKGLVSKGDSVNLSSQLMFDANVRSCLNIAEWATLRKKPLVFLSGATVYENPNASKIAENAPEVKNGLGGLYGYTKLLAEKVIGHFVEDGLKSIILRPSSVYGYGLDENKLVAKFLINAAKDVAVEASEPDVKINFIHAIDVSRAALSAYENSAWGVFNLSSNKAVSVRELAELCVNITGRGHIKVPNVGIKTQNFTRFDLDCSKAKKEFGFDRVLSLQDGLRLMLEEKTVVC